KAHSALKNALVRFDREIAAEVDREVDEPSVGKANDSKARPILTKPQDRKIQPPTIFILGTDAQHCNELRNILQGHVAADIVTNGTDLSTIKESDTIILRSEEINAGFLYRRLLNKLEEQVQRAELLSQLIHLFSSSLNTDELLERVVSKSTEVLGDTSFI